MSSPAEIVPGAVVEPGCTPAGRPAAVDFTRDELRDLHTRSSALGTTLVVCDLVGYALSILFITRQASWLGQAMFAVPATIFVGRLFMLGHDACHQSLTPNRRLNRWLGSVAFLTSLHPYSLWDFGHNRIHHRYTNQRGLDYVWEPLDPEEYARLPLWQRARYRLFRTPIGHFAYYGADIWWRKMFFPRPSEIGGYRREYIWDHVLVGTWCLLLPTAIVLLRYFWRGPDLAWSSYASVLFWAWFVPVFVFLLSMSTLIYLHHTHPRVVWTKGEPMTTEAQLGGAVHVILPGFMERTLHHIMEHTAHHARPGIPLYHLTDGQAILEERHEDVIVEKWTLKFHLDTLRRCKLFDLRTRTWVGYGGV